MCDAKNLEQGVVGKKMGDSHDMQQLGRFQGTYTRPMKFLTSAISHGKELNSDWMNAARLKCSTISS